MIVEGDRQHHRVAAVAGRAPREALVFPGIGLEPDDAKVPGGLSPVRLEPAACADVGEDQRVRAIFRLEGGIEKDVHRVSVYTSNRSSLPAVETGIGTARPASHMTRFGAIHVPMTARFLFALVLSPALLLAAPQDRPQKPQAPRAQPQRGPAPSPIPA